LNRRSNDELFILKLWYRPLKISQQAERAYGLNIHLIDAILIAKHLRRNKDDSEYSS